MYIRERGKDKAEDGGDGDVEELVTVIITNRTQDSLIHHGQRISQARARRRPSTSSDNDNNVHKSLAEAAGDGD